ncbi:hypothetical protein Pelo_1469 [Pelomyxa schiedti]|nr:hypothetical protein Pelo_1469 [Pelomyxa schiedti]
MHKPQRGNIGRNAAASPARSSFQPRPTPTRSPRGASSSPYGKYNSTTRRYPATRDYRDDGGGEDDEEDEEAGEGPEASRKRKTPSFRAPRGSPAGPGLGRRQQQQQQRGGLLGRKYDAADTGRRHFKREQEEEEKDGQYEEDGDEELGSDGDYEEEEEEEEDYEGEDGEGDENDAVDEDGEGEEDAMADDEEGTGRGEAEGTRGGRGGGGAARGAGAGGGRGGRGAAASGSGSSRTMNNAADAHFREFMDLFWKLTEKKADPVSAAYEMGQFLSVEQAHHQEGEIWEDGLCPDMCYAISRLLKGLGSDSPKAVKGFLLCFVHLLEIFPCITIDFLLKRLRKIFPETKGYSENRRGFIYAIHGLLKARKFASPLPSKLRLVYLDGRSELGYSACLGIINQVPESSKEFLFSSFSHVLKDRIAYWNERTLVLAISIEYKTKILASTINTELKPHSLISAENLPFFKPIFDRYFKWTAELCKQIFSQAYTQPNPPAVIQVLWSYIIHSPHQPELKVQSDLMTGIFSHMDRQTLYTMSEHIHLHPFFRILYSKSETDNEHVQFLINFLMSLDDQVGFMKAVALGSANNPSSPQPNSAFWEKLLLQTGISFSDISAEPSSLISSLLPVGAPSHVDEKLNLRDIQNELAISICLTQDMVPFQPVLHKLFQFSYCKTRDASAKKKDPLVRKTYTSILFELLWVMEQKKTLDPTLPPYTQIIGNMLLDNYKEPKPSKSEFVLLEEFQALGPLLLETCLFIHKIKNALLTCEERETKIYLNQIWILLESLAVALFDSPALSKPLKGFLSVFAAVPDEQSQVEKGPVPMRSFELEMDSFSELICSSHRWISSLAKNVFKAMLPCIVCYWSINDPAHPLSQSNNLKGKKKPTEASPSPGNLVREHEVNSALLYFIHKLPEAPAFALYSSFAAFTMENSLSSTTQERLERTLSCNKRATRELSDTETQAAQSCVLELIRSVSKSTWSGNNMQIFTLVAQLLAPTPSGTKVLLPKLPLSEMVPLLFSSPCNNFLLQAIASLPQVGTALSLEVIKNIAEKHPDCMAISDNFIRALRSVTKLQESLCGSVVIFVNRCTEILTESARHRFTFGNPVAKLLGRFLFLSCSVKIWQMPPGLWEAVKRWEQTQGTGYVLLRKPRHPPPQRGPNNNQYANNTPAASPRF